MTQFEQFGTGAVRDSQDGKPRFDLIGPTFLQRLAQLLADKATHYGDRNWEQGIQMSRSLASLERHVQAIKRGEREEDHIAQAAANLMFLAEEQDGPHDDLESVIGPSLRRHREEDMAKFTEKAEDEDYVNIDFTDGLVRPLVDFEPDRRERYQDAHGSTWMWDNGWYWQTRYGSLSHERNDWKNVTVEHAKSFPWSPLKRTIYLLRRDSEPSLSHVYKDAKDRVWQHIDNQGLDEFGWRHVDGWRHKEMTALVAYDWDSVTSYEDAAFPWRRVS